MTTEAEGSDKFTRTSVFSLTAAPAEAEQTEILNRITSRAGELAEVTAAVDEAGIYSVTVTQEGSEEELDESCQAVFGNGLSIGKAEEKMCIRDSPISDRGGLPTGSCVGGNGGNHQLPCGKEGKRGQEGFEK